MTLLIPAATNLTKNPRPASLTNLEAAGGGPDPVLVYDRSYSGQTSAKFTFTAATQQAVWRTNEAEDFGGTVTGETQEFYGKARFLTLTGADVKVSLVIEYEDATTDAGDELSLSLPSADSWVVVSPLPVESDPLKDISFVSLVIESDSASEQILYLGGLDIRSNQDVDSFVVGGTRYAEWEGTENASISIRSAYSLSPIVQRGAQIRYRAKYFVVNRKNVIQDDITQFVLPTPSINVDMLGEATKGVLTISLDRPDIVKPFSDMWVSPRLTIEHPDGTIEGGDGNEGMLGIYSVEPASERYEAMGNSFNYTGYDLLWVLQQETLQPTAGSDTLYAPQGTSYLIAPGGPLSFRGLLKQIFEDGGFTEADGMLLLPNPANQPPIQYEWGAEVGTTRMDFITKTCDAMAWRRPWVTLQGQMTSEPKRDLALVEPDYIFESGDNSDVRYPLEVDPEPEDMANRVRVFGKWYGYQDAINISVENADPSHPFSTVSLGYRRPDGTIQKRYIDAPMIDKVVLHNAQQAIDTGLAELATRGMLPYVVRMRTRTMIRQLNEVYQLALSDANGDPITPNGQGKYWCVGWQMSLGSPWEMIHTLRRLIPIVETQYGPPDEVHKFPVPVYNQQQLNQISADIKRLTREAKLAKSPGGKEINKKELKEIKDLKKQRKQILNGLRAGKVTWVES